MYPPRTAAALAVALALVALTAGRADAFELKHTKTGRVVRWPGSEVGFTLDPTVAAVPGGPEAVAAAVAQWSAAAGAPNVSVASDGSSGAVGYDGVNRVMYVKGGYAPAGRALAITVVTFENDTGAIVDADIVFNGKYKLARVLNTILRESEPDDDAGKKENKMSTRRHAHDLDAEAEATYDIGRIASHELGHALGLSDEPEHEAAVMFPFVSPDVATRTTPADDDLEGLRAIYETDAPADGEEPGASAAGCGASVAPRRCAPWPAGVSAFALAAVGLSALARRRRGRLARGAPVACAALVAALVAPETRAVAAEPAARSTTELRAVVDDVTTVAAADGIFRSSLTLSPGDGRPAVRVTVLGGTLGRLRQEVSGSAVPARGDAVDVVLDPRETGSLSATGRVRLVRRVPG